MGNWREEPPCLRGLLFRAGSKRTHELRFMKKKKTREEEHSLKASWLMLLTQRGGRWQGHMQGSSIGRKPLEGLRTRWTEIVRLKKSVKRQRGFHFSFPIFSFLGPYKRDFSINVKSKTEGERLHESFRCDSVVCIVEGDRLHESHIR